MARRTVLLVIMGVILLSLLSGIAFGVEEQYGLVGIIPVGDNPVDLAVTANGDKAVAINGVENTVSIVDTKLQDETKRLFTQDQPVVAVVKDRLAYVATLEGSTISIIDLDKEENIKSIHTDGNPRDLEFSNDKTEMYVANFGASSIEIVDTSTNEIIDKIETKANPKDMAVSPDGKKLYVVNLADGILTVIDLEKREIEEEVKVGKIDNPFPIFVDVSSDGDRVYVLCQKDESVAVLNTNTNKIIRNVPTGNFPWRIKAVGKKVYVSNLDGKSISVIDGVQAEPLKKIQVGRRPWGLETTRSGDVLFVAASREDRVYAIDTADDKIIDEIDVGVQPLIVRVNPNRPEAYVIEAKSNTLSVLGFGTEDRIDPMEDKGGAKKSHGAFIPFVGRAPSTNEVILIMAAMASLVGVGLYILRRRKFI